MAVIILETARAHLQCSKVAEFKPARSCQSFAPLRRAHKGGGEGKLVNGSSHRRTQHVGLEAMWCEMNGGGVRKGGGRQQRKKGIHASLRWEPQLKSSSKTFKSDPSTAPEKTLPHPSDTSAPTSVSQHPPNSCQLPLDSSGGVCVYM